MKRNLKLIESYYPMIHKDKLIYKYGDKLIRIGTDDNDVVEIKNAHHWLFPVLKAMNGNNTIRDILSNYKEVNLPDLSKIIFKLIQLDTATLLDNPFNVISKNTRFKSDLTYYFSEGIDGKAVLNKLRKFKVGIFGAGGGGSLIALQLANLGIKNIHLVDPDIITISNLNRQFMFNINDIGKYKVSVVKSFLENRHSDLNVTTSIKRIENINDAIKEVSNCDWIFCCIDEPPYIAQRIINRAGYIKNIPSVYGFSSRDAAKLLIVKPGITGCIDCLLDNEDTPAFQKLIKSLQKSNFTPVTPIIIPNMMLETSWMVKKWLDEVLKRQSLGNTLFRFDYNKLHEDKFVVFSKKEDCPTCGKEVNSSKLWDIIPIE